MEHKIITKVSNEAGNPCLRQLAVSGSLPSIDWHKLRDEYFKECILNGDRVDLAPHDLFEWFKRKLSEGNDR